MLTERLLESERSVYSFAEIVRLFVSFFSGSVKALVLRRDSDWYGACFGMLRQPIRPAAAAAAIEKAQ